LIVTLFAVMKQISGHNCQLIRLSIVKG